MDLNETLRLLRLTIKQMRVDTDPTIRQAHADEIAEYAEALDDLLSKGIALPEDWAKNQSFINRANGQPCSTCDTYHRNCP